MTRIASAAGAGALLLLAACGPTGPSATSSHAPSLPTFEAQLSQAGIPVVPDFGNAASRWQFTRFQAAVMDGQLASRQGFLGSELDAEAPMSAGGATVSYLVAAWITGARTPRSTVVAGWMGPQDWRHAPAVVFPVAALALFSVDMAEHMAADAGRTKAAAAPPGGVALMDIVSAPCTTVDGFFSGAILQLFNLLHLSPSFLGSSGPLGIVGAFVAGIWNTLTSLVQGALTGIASKLAAPIVEAISVAVGAISLVSQIGAVMGAWNLKAVVTPPGGPSGLDRFAVGGEPAHRNTIVLSASSLLESVPKALQDCATSLGSPLPSTLDPGTTITWTVLTNEGVVDFPDGLKTTVAADGTTTLKWTTGREAGANGREVSGVAELHTLVQNPGATALVKFTQRLIQGAVNAVIGSTVAPVVVNFLNGLAAPVIAGIQSRLGASGFARATDVVLLVIHHECDPNGGCPSPSASPTRTPTPSPSCLVGTWVTSRLLDVNITGGSAGVAVLTIADAGDGSLRFTNVYDPSHKVSESIQGHSATATFGGAENGTLRAAGNQLTILHVDNGVSETLAFDSGTTANVPVDFAPGGIGSATAFNCTASTLQLLIPTPQGPQPWSEYARRR